MTAINHLIGKQTFESLANRSNILELLDRIRNDIYAVSLEKTEDMKGLSLGTLEGEEQARSMMDLNVVSTNMQSRSGTSLYIPHKIFSEVSPTDIQKALSEEVEVLPMIGDKDVFMLRTLGVSVAAMISMNTQVKEFFKESGVEEPTFEGIAFERPLVKRPQVLVEGMDKPFRRGEKFQDTITEGAQKVQFLLNMRPDEIDALMEDDAPLSSGPFNTPLHFDARVSGMNDVTTGFDFLPPENFHYA